MGLISLLFESPIAFVIITSTLLISVVAHEVAHGWVAFAFGDDTARRSGRLSWNPIRHLDPMGTLVLLVTGRFGWAKPVPVDFYKVSEHRFGVICVSLAGCLTNICIAAAALCLLQVKSIDANLLFKVVLIRLAAVNMILGVFNLIPIPPLDGSKILMEFLPNEARRSMVKIEPYGFFILLALIYIGLLNPVFLGIHKVLAFFVH